MQADTKISRVLLLAMVVAMTVHANAHASFIPPVAGSGGGDLCTWVGKEEGLKEWGKQTTTFILYQTLSV